MMKSVLSFAFLVLTLFYTIGANLLFKDGFEGSTRLHRYHCCKPGVDQWWMGIKGESDTAGWVWPDDLPFDYTGHFQYQIFYDDTDGELMVWDPRKYVYDDFRYEPGRGRVLYSRVIEDFIPPAGARSAGIARSNYFAEPESTATGQLYMCYWRKFSPNLGNMMNSRVGTISDPDSFVWYDMFEIKTYPNTAVACSSNPFNFDMRQSVQIIWNPSQGLHWRVEVETLYVDSCKQFGFDKYISIQDETTPIPLGSWFKFEVFWKQGADASGRFFVRVDGDTLADINDMTYRGDLYAQKFNIFKNYVDTSIVNTYGADVGGYVETWYDDIEFWDDIP